VESILKVPRRAKLASDLGKMVAWYLFASVRPSLESLEVV